MAYKMKGPSLYKDSPVKQKPHPAGTGVGHLAKKIAEASPAGRIYKKAKKAYDTYKGKKAVKKSSHTSMGSGLSPKPGDKMMGKKEGKLMAKQSMKKVAKKGEAWPKVRRITDSKGRLIKH